VCTDLFENDQVLMSRDEFIKGEKVKRIFRYTDVVSVNCDEVDLTTLVRFNDKD